MSRPLHFCFVLQSPDLTLEQLGRIASVCLLQLTKDVARWWTPAEIDTDLTLATVSVVDSFDKVPIDSPARRTIAVVALPTPDLAEALGYHSLSPDGRPYARVFTREQSFPGAPDVVIEFSKLPSVFSHEVIEAAVDPDLDRSIVGLDGVNRDLEACDMVEDQTVAFAVEGQEPLLLSDFSTPAAFRGGARPYNFLDTLSAPGEMSDGGYISITKADGSHATLPPDMMLAPAKQHPASRTYRRLH